MKTTDEQLDKLTRKLMEGTVEKPSAALIGKVLAKVEKERQTVGTVSILSSRPVVVWMTVGLFVYFILTGALGYLFLCSSGSTDDIVSPLNVIFPFATLIISGVSIFFFCTQLDNWLRWKRISV